MTPLVIVMWRQRLEAFLRKYHEVNFKTLAQAMQEPGGWGAIAGKPQWGDFKFSHTRPETSNSGLMCLVLMAYHSAEKQSNLTVADCTTPKFQDWLRGFERRVTRFGAVLDKSTGTFMKEMVERGPKGYDALIVYENLLVDYLDVARKKWAELGELDVIYPEPNFMNENPYYILNVPWSHEKEQRAAADFLHFLMSPEIQKKALKHGFRPGNTTVTIDQPSSPLIKYKGNGLRIDYPPLCDPPDAEVVEELLRTYSRIER
jgi:Ca-activated chloride channel homolog